MKTATCIHRIQDHTDSVDCGDVVFRANLCVTHVKTEEDRIRRAIKAHEHEITSLREQYVRLTTEAG